MYVKGIDIKYRDGDCLKQSLAFLLEKSLADVPNFHKLPLSTWKLAFETWVTAQKKVLSVVERDKTTEASAKPVSKKHIAVFRVWNKKTQEKMYLHAVVMNEKNEIIFDILEGENSNLDYRYVARRYLIN